MTDQTVEKTGVVYVLKHPHTGEIRYVGITTQKLSARLNRHIWVARNSIQKTHCADWIFSLLKLGLRPVIEIVLEVPVSELNNKEVEYIAKFIKDGANLTNLTSGGQAQFSVSAETKAKQSKAKLGKPLSVEHRKNIAKAQLGSKHSEETKKKMSEIAMGRSHDEKCRKKISENRKSSGVAKGSNNPNAKLSEDKVLEIYDKLKLGYSDRQIADEYGLLRNSIAGIRKGRTWKHLYKEHFTK